MSTTPNPNEEPQQWRTYPGVPSDNASGSHQPPYANPTPDDQYRAYQDYGQNQPGYEQPGYPSDQPPMQPYSSEPAQPSKSRGLNQTWQYIILGAIAAIVITAVGRGGNWFGLIIFVGIAWWIWNGRKR